MIGDKLTVVLEPLEYLFASQAAFLRQASNVVKGRKDARNFKGDGWEAHVVGAVGEFVVAKALGLFWGGPGKFRGDDVGPLQVRTRSRPSKEFLVYETDAQEARFVMVSGEFPRYTVHGWIYGGDAQNPKWWKDPLGGRPCYFVPEAALRPVSELHQLLKEQASDPASNL